MLRHFTRRGMLAGAAGLLALTHAQAAKADALANFSLTAHKPPVPNIHFTNPQGELKSLADYRGKTVLFNAWATWCGPCIKEMPALDAAAKELGSEAFAVLPVSMDRDGALKVDLFYREYNLKNLPILIEHEAEISRLLKPRGLPFTLLIDRDGNEIGRALGEVFWNATESIGLLKQYI